MKRVLILMVSVAMLLGSGLATLGAEDPAKTGTDFALGGAVIRDGVSYAAETPGWTIYFRPGVRISNHDRVMGYFDFLVPLYFTDKSVLFFNPKANFDNNENVEWNVGVGYRHLLADDKLILGGNIFYDGRKSYSGNYFHQIGLGAEVLTEWVNARVNGYISLSDAKESDRWREYYFGSTSLNYSWAYRLEEPMSGLDYEVGFKIPGLSNYVETWVYGGGYNYFSDYTDDMVGWSTRIEVVPADFVKLNFTVRDDNLRETEYAGEVALELPFSIENLMAGKDPFEGIGDVLKGSRPMKERLYEQVRRDVDITVGNIDYTRGTHPDEVIPGEVVMTGSFVNTSGDLVTALAGASAGDFVYVNAGTYTGHFIVPSGVMLWGPGYDPYGLGLTGTSVINGGGTGNIVSIGNGSTVAGFELTNGSVGVLGGGWGGGSISGASVLNNVIHNNLNTGSSGIGIALFGNVDNCTISGNTVYDNDRQGIFIGDGSHSGSSGNTISYNTIYHNGLNTTGLGPDASRYGIQLMYSDNNTIEGNTIYNHPDFDNTLWISSGIYPYASENNTIRNNNLFNNEIGVFLYSNNSSGPNKINNNNIYGNLYRGIYNYDAFTIDATNNWWGGPGGPGVGGNNGVSGNVTTDPYSNTEF